jgi:phage tail sheath protein FI
VVTDASVNPPQSVEQGRFVAQIQVAPSQPMEFITVLLTRTGEGLLQAMEA